jgi:hypothetical protein
LYGLTLSVGAKLGALAVIDRGFFALVGWSQPNSRRSTIVPADSIPANQRTSNDVRVAAALSTQRESYHD